MRRVPVDEEFGLPIAVLRNSPIVLFGNGTIAKINDARDKFSNGDLIIDSRIGYQINNIFKLGFVINNLLNTEYMSRPANMMPPRTYAFQFNMKI